MVPQNSHDSSRKVKEEGNGQDVYDQEVSEFLSEGRDAYELLVDYKLRLTNEIWNNAAFRQDLINAREVYLKNIQLPLDKQDDTCKGRLNQELRDKYQLNQGWLIWVSACLETGENDPKRLHFYTIRKKGENAKYLSLDIYFPLPESLYEIASVYLRMKEPEAFGDYYSQKQGGGRRLDQELYKLFSEWQSEGFNPRKKKVFRQLYINAHPENSLAARDFDAAMKRYKRKAKAIQES